MKRIAGSLVVAAIGFSFLLAGLDAPALGGAKKLPDPVAAARKALDQAKAAEAAAKEVHDKAKAAFDAKNRDIQKARQEVDKLQEEVNKTKNPVTKTAKQAALDAARKGLAVLDKAVAPLRTAMEEARAELERKTQDTRTAQQRLDTLLRGNSKANKHALVVLLENGGVSASLGVILGKDAKTKAEATDPLTDATIESITKAIIRARAAVGKQYDRVIILDDIRFRGVSGEKNEKNIVTELDALAPTHCVDIHVLSHGTTKQIIGYNKRIVGFSGNSDNLFHHIAALTHRKQDPLQLRTVYQLQCVSGSLVKDWLDAGAKAVCGTQRYTYKDDKGATQQSYYLNYMPTQYVHFLDAWLAGNSFDKAVHTGSQKAATYFEPFYRKLKHPEFVTRSMLQVSGSGGISVNAP